MSELLWSAVITGDTRTKKNSPRIVGAGRKCPACGKQAKQWIVPSKAHDLWFRASCRQLAGQIPPETIAGPVQLVYTVWTGTRRKVDDLNLYGAIDDLLVACKVIDDDNVNVIRSRDGSRVLYDPDAPRVEIRIFRATEAGQQLELEVMR